MNFLRWNRYALLTMGVIFLASALVVREYVNAQSAHTSQVEDFLVLHEHGGNQASEHAYQVLIQQLPRINDRWLVEDLERTAMLFPSNPPPVESLVWKYHLSVRNELRHRSEARLRQLLDSNVR